MLTFAEALAFGKHELARDDAAMDVELLLAYATQSTRSHIYAWPQKKLDAEQEKVFFALIGRAKRGEPIAYLTHQKEFWSLELSVTPETLIPRPETELLVEIILKEFSQVNKLRLLDMGTGSGAIALALAREKPEWDITATDISSNTLAVARHNAENLQIKNVTFLQSDWFDHISTEKKFSVIVSNPPYISEDDAACAANVKAYEPALALFSKEKGLADLKRIIDGAGRFLEKNGFLLVEHGFEQALPVNQLFAQNGYENIHLYQDLSGHDRVTVGYHTE
jgi:release factor glutamine methyltransferase